METGFQHSVHGTLTHGYRPLRRRDKPLGADHNSRHSRFMAVGVDPEGIQQGIHPVHIDDNPHFVDSLALFMNDELIDATAAEIILPKQ